MTDNGMAFADLPKNRYGRSRRFLGPHIFDRVCAEHGIQTRAEATAAIGRYIDGFDNPVRRQSTLDFISPLQFERRPE